MLILFLFFVCLLAYCARANEIAWKPAKSIYTVQSLMSPVVIAHFSYGEQLFYPATWDMECFITFEQASGINENEINASRRFLGNEFMGYKTALCQRDMAIYSVILVFGFVFSLTGKKIKPIPWYVWVLFGLGPIGLDGFSQLLSQTGWAIFEWIPLRESTPLFRGDGCLFGLASPGLVIHTWKNRSRKTEMRCN